MRPVRDPEGQHRAVGVVLAGFGAFTITLGVAMTLAGVVDVGFLDGPTVCIIGAAMIGTGGWQWLSGRRYRQELGP